MASSSNTTALASDERNYLELALREGAVCSGECIPGRVLAELDACGLLDEVARGVFEITDAGARAIS